MTEMETKIASFFKLCKMANKTFQTVDMSSQQKAIIAVKKESKKLFEDLETIVSIMGVKDLYKEIPNRKMILQLLYILLRSLSVFSEKGISRYEDARSVGSCELSQKVGKMKMYSNFGSTGSWYKNKDVFEKGVVGGFAVAAMHNTLLQSLIRDLVQTLMYPDIYNQEVPDYMERFERVVLYYLRDCPSDERVYLDYI